MEFYSMEQFEIFGDMMEDFREWEEYEKDMESNPFGEEIPTEKEIEEMMKDFFRA